MVVGRSKVGKPDIEIFDVAAAPRHCIIDWDKKLKCHSLTVLGTNGLHLNDRHMSGNIEPQKLENGDVIQIGDTILVYTSDKQITRGLH